MVTVPHKLIHVLMFEGGMMVRNNTTYSLTPVYDPEAGRIDLHDLTLFTVKERITPLIQIIVKDFLDNSGMNDWVTYGFNDLIVKITKKYTNKQ